MAKKVYTLKEVILKAKQEGTNDASLCDTDMTIASKLGLLTLHGTENQLITILQIFRDYSVLLMEHSAIGEFCNQLQEHLEETDDQLFDDKGEKVYDA